MPNMEFSPSALEDLKALRKFDQRRILESIEAQLAHEPGVETRNRKHLRPNQMAAWELRVGQFRVFYNLNEQEAIVAIEAIGFKVGNLLFIRGESREL